ncbi:MAG: hypothetical protein P8N02_20210 [Actinomycetota bacterium]|jgi:hypothetical protein|nr:hypothetical protein [Actinomycetota bacterium]
MTDDAELYLDTRDRLIGLFLSLDAEEAAVQVPFSPEWTIGDVARHVCGINADVASGRLERLGTDERTTHQVRVRAGHTLAQICAEWIGHESAMVAAIDADPWLGQRLAADLVVHLHDVQHALGLSIDRVDDATISAGRTYASIVPALVAERSGVDLCVELTEVGRPASDDGGLVLRAFAWDFLRSATGRRSRRQVTALDWTGDPTPVLDAISPYGPLRSEDAEI